MKLKSGVLVEQRIEQETAACNGKAAGDACLISNPRGNNSGTCQMQNSTLMCNANFSGRQRHPNIQQ